MCFGKRRGTGPLSPEFCDYGCLMLFGLCFLVRLAPCLVRFFEARSFSSSIVSVTVTGVLHGILVLMLLSTVYALVGVCLIQLLGLERIEW